MDFQKRIHQPEKMDEIDKNHPELEAVLKALSKINFWLGNTGVIKRTVLKKVKKIEQKEVCIIDLGCGGGDILISLAKALRKEGLIAQLIGIDGNDQVLNYARNKAIDFPEIEWKKANILDSEFELSRCDFLISSHFMYHFKEGHLISFLNKHKKKIKREIIISELERNKLAYLLFKWINFFLPFPKMILEDGLLAIRRSYRKKEWEALVDQLTYKKSSVRKILPFRLLICLRV